MKTEKTEAEYFEYLEEIRESARRLGFDSLDAVFEEHLRCRFFGKDVVIGQSKRLRLRELKHSDLDAMEHFADAGTESVLEAFLMENHEESERFLKKYIEYMYPMYEYGIWAVEKRETGEMIGLCGLGTPKVHGEDCTDIGYYICPRCRKRGYAEEAVKIVLDYAKNYLEIPLVYAIIRKENWISAEILHKFDFADVSLPEDDRQGVFVYQKQLSD